MKASLAARYAATSDLLSARARPRHLTLVGAFCIATIMKRTNTRFRSRRFASPPRRWGADLAVLERYTRLPGLDFKNRQNCGLERIDAEYRSEVERARFRFVRLWTAQASRF